MNCPDCRQPLVEDAVYCSHCGRVMGRCEPPVRYAGFWRRSAATILDAIILWPAITMSLIVFTDLMLPSPDGRMWFEPRESGGELLRSVQDASNFAWAVFLALAPYYIAAETSPLRATLGKRLLGMAVTDLRGNRIGAGRAAIRFVARIASHAPLLLGFVMAAFTAKKQALHDFAARTVVVLAPGGPESAGPCFRYAGFWRRVLAVLLDVAFLALPLLIASAALVRRPSEEHSQIMAESRVDRRMRPAHREAFRDQLRWCTSQSAVIFLLFSLYATLTEGSRLQGTLGKRIVGLRVTDLEGRRIRRRTAAARCAARLLSAFSWHAGFVMAAFTGKRQALHDIVTGTLVLRSGPEG